MINMQKAVMIGCGFVGSASVFALMQSGIFSEIALIDANMEKAEGEYRKYQVKTLSSVEKAYIETLKELKQIENKTKEKNERGHA